MYPLSDEIYPLSDEIPPPTGGVHPSTLTTKARSQIPGIAMIPPAVGGISSVMCQKSSGLVEEMHQVILTVMPKEKPAG